MDTGTFKRIFRLPEEVVNRIAAGEIIQRPASALKEMLENSLDAGATRITISVKEGGSKFLQIQDNGHGIQAEDLPLLCERHATSKLRSFEDLTGINTLGFRGEALASISYVAHLSVTTMTAGAPHGYKVAYRDGVMDDEGPKPCASSQGTTLTVEDLFYNVPTRKKAFKSVSQEMSRILDVVGCYAIFKPEIGFTVKKQGEARADLHTLPGSSRQENIRNVFGGSLGRNLLELNLERSSDRDMDVDGAAQLVCNVTGYITNADYSGKKTVMVLFINGRPVDCAHLKKAIENTYSSMLPKAAKPWIYLDLRLPGDHVDVNLHPTKKEVGFLHQDQLIEAICTAVEDKLTSSNQRRTFVQTQLPGTAALEASQELGDGLTAVASTKRDKAGGDNKLVRTDSRARTLDSYIRPPDSPRSDPGLDDSQSGALFQDVLASSRRRGSERGTIRVREQWENEERSKSLEKTRSVRQRPNPASSELESVQTLLENVERKVHKGMLDMIQSHTFVGMADSVLALLQHGTRLYLANTTAITREMFYQQVLNRFEAVKHIDIQGDADVQEVARLALESEADELVGERESIDEVAALIKTLLREKAEMLQTCFGIRLDGQTRICTLPQLIEGYVPDLDYLPQFVLNLARDVDWETEEECFEGIAKAIAEFYSWKAHDSLEDKAECRQEQGQRQASRLWTAQHVVYPALRMFWKPSQGMIQGLNVVELTRLEHLYKIFERC